MGMTATSNLETLLESMQQAGVTLGNITVQTDYTSPADIASIANSLQSYSTKVTEVDSPTGSYILGSSASDTITGGPAVMIRFMVMVEIIQLQMEMAMI